MSLSRLIITDPKQFITALKEIPNYLSLDVAKKLDQDDPLSFTQQMFQTDTLIPFAGHSLGPIFKPVITQIEHTTELQKQLHAGHFPGIEGNYRGNWFDFDREENSLRAAQQLLGFKELHEFTFTASGLSQNLGMLMDTFFSPTKQDWLSGKSKIVMLETEFFSDQAVANSVMKRALKRAEKHGCFENTVKPNHSNEILKISPDVNGLYNTKTIIDFIKSHADKIQMICLSDIVFNTGQRLELDKIFESLKDIIIKNDIKVLIDLAHTVGNRPINLASMPITAAVGCGYKHLCGYPGSGFGIYVNGDIDLEEYPPLQGWKAANSTKVFDKINTFDPSIMDYKTGAVAFRTSNPAPLALLPVQTFLSEFLKIGFDKCFNKSECLTQYLILQLQEQLNDKIDIITPLDSNQRGATIAIRIKGEDVKIIEDKLKNLGFEIDSRPPNILRMTAHYGYTKFTDIHRFVISLKNVLTNKLEYKEGCSTLRTCGIFASAEKNNKSNTILNPAAILKL